MADEPLEERLNTSQKDESELEKTVKEESDWKLRTILWDGIKYSPFLALNYAIAGPASLLTPFGLAIGKFFANRKKKKKTTWNETRKTMAVGNFGGSLAYWLYQVPDFLVGSPVGLAGKVIKTLIFNPFMVAGWVAYYRTASYIVNKYGGWGLIKSLFNSKIFRYTKEAYHEDLKKKYWPTLGEAFLTLAPIHFYSMNYVANPTYRVAIGAGNDALVSMIAGEEGILKRIKNKLIAKKEEKPNIVQYPSPAQAYKRPAA